MISKLTLKKLAAKHGTPLFVVDHDELRRNYATFKKYLPRVQAYYAVKANSDPAIVRRFTRRARVLMSPRCRSLKTSMKTSSTCPAKERQDWIWDKIIYANPTKAIETLKQLDQYKPLVTFDNHEEIKKIKKYAPHAGLALRLKVPNTGAMVELSSKFGASPGEAVDLILAADQVGLDRRGHQFSRRQPDDEFRELRPGPQPVREHFQGGARPRLHEDEPARHRRRLSRALRRKRQAVPRTGESHQRRNGPAVSRNDPSFPKKFEILAEPGRFLCATAATAVSKIIGKAVRDGKLCYYIDDGVYHTFSGVIFDHCQYHLKAFKNGPTQICSVFGPTCDALDVVSMAENLPTNLELGDLLYSEHIGAYSHASSTWFNGFPPAKVVHVNQ